MLNPFDAAGLQRLAAANLTAFALEAAPRTTRAQSMDVLSSQANIAGYKAVMIAADKYQRFFPMLMTAAGTVKAARVVILGVGVAGLQAIATAKRLGAVIEASDVRPSVKEQVESLGAKFIDVPYETDEEKEAAEGVGGYARPMPQSWLDRQKVEVAKRVAAADMVITTALIPGRAAPVLVTEEMVKAMKPGSVIVDLAAPQGGNCPLTEAEQDRGQARRHPGGRDQPAGAGGGRCLRAVCAQRAGLPEAGAAQGGRLQDRSRGRHRRRLPDGTRRPGHQEVTEQLRGGHTMDPVSHTVINLIIFVLAIYVGYHVVWTVTPALHTPLMAVTNAISAIVIVGAMLAAALTESALGKTMGVLAVALAAVNVFGGFLVTRRMLEMFKKKDKKAPRRAKAEGRDMSMNVVTLLYLIASVCFIQSLKGLSHPTTSIRGNLFGMVGMAIAILTTAALIVQLSGGKALGMGWVLLGLVVGGGYGAYRAKTVEMTQMPELVAFFHSMIGLAAVFIAVAAVVEPWAFGITPRRWRRCRRQHAEGAWSSTASCATPFPRATGSSCSWARPSAPSPSRGSVIAFGKLSGKYKFRLFQGAPVQFKGQHMLNLVLGLLTIGAGPGVHGHRELDRLLRDAGAGLRDGRARSSSRSAAPTCRWWCRCSTATRAGRRRASASR